jgi:hypothetical protein
MRHCCALLGFFVAFGLSTFSLSAQAQEQTDKQRILAGRYAQLEQIFLRLAETSGNSNPRQAALLKKALLESKDKLLVQRFEMLVSTLDRRQLSDAVTGQTEIEQDLLQILKLLESVNRDERREQEKEAVKEFLKDLEEILHRERSLKNLTQQQESQNLPSLEKTQRDTRLQTQTLRERIAEHEGVRSQESGAENQESEQAQNQSEQRESTPSTPTQRAMHKALERMKQAEEKLRNAEKEGAIESQEEAIAELQRVKEELEKILRQLREEELMQTLEKLGARFKRMLQQEQTIRSQTEKLLQDVSGEPPLDVRQTKIRADRLTVEQQSVIEDAESALLLLREDGTAQAMVESLLQARFDMTDVKARLEQTSVDATTLFVEDAVIDTLQEMLEAVQAALSEAQERQENAGGQQQQDGEEEPLIQLLAELRMIRSMQRRVNERTARYDTEIKRVLEKPDADLSSLKQAVEELARQQNRISRILHELKIGKTN